MEIRITGERTVDTDSLTTEQVGQLIEELQDIAAGIKHQIAVAKARKVELGEPVSGLWMANAERALSYKNRDIQRLRKLLGAHAQVKAANARTRAEYFVDICKEKLDRDMFNSFSAWAEDRRVAAINEATAELDR